MTQAPHIPNEVLSIIFKKLANLDLVSCSYICWQWNMVANPLIYTRVHISSIPAFEKLIKTIESTKLQVHNDSEVSSRQRPHLGSYINEVRLLYKCYEVNEEIEQSHLTQLASSSPNVHTIVINNLQSVFGRSAVAKRLNTWREISAQWPLLRHLTIAFQTVIPPQLSEAFVAVYGMEDLSDQLYSLDVNNCC